MEFKHALQLINHPMLTGDAPMVWADLGAGAGLFTNALASKLAAGSKIYAVDKKPKLLNTEKQSKVEIEIVKADFVSEKMNIGKVDGILMANALHFVAEKMEFLSGLQSLFRNGGYFLIIEYDMSWSNPWVPYPIPFKSLHQLFSTLGYQLIDKIHEHPSKYHQANIYSALIK
jgi:trans-aconitate methyltransferase